MEKRKLGKSDIAVGPLALGTNVFGWTADETMSHRLLDAFCDAGLNLVDTADVYSRWIPGHKGGEAESIIGTWFKKSKANRERIVVATKVGIEMADGKGLSKTYILRAVEASLKRLQTDYIDLYQSHIDDPETPQEETLSAYGELITAGKVRIIGASNFTAERLAESRAIAKANASLPIYSTLQPHYNLYQREGFEGALADLCQRESISVIPYFSLAAGFLTGKYRTEKDLEGKPRGYSVKAMMNERGMRILAGLDKVAKETSATPAQIALAWLVAKGIAAPIASATSLKQLEDIVGSTRLKLSSDQVTSLDEASAY